MYWWFAKSREGTIGYRALKIGVGDHYWKTAERYVKGDTENGVPNTWAEFLDLIGLGSYQKSRKRSGEEATTFSDIFAAAVICRAEPGKFVPSVSEMVGSYVRYLACDAAQADIDACASYLQLVMNDGDHNAPTKILEPHAPLLRRMALPSSDWAPLWERIQTVLLCVEAEAGRPAESDEGEWRQRLWFEKH